MWAQDGREDLAPTYEFVFGGWLNKKCALRKRGVQVCSARAAPLNSASFVSLWIYVADGVLACGVGDVHSGTLIRWRDEAFEPRAHFVGFSTWNAPAVLRNIEVRTTAYANPGP